MAKPFHHSVNRAIVALDNRFDAPVGNVPYPSREAEFLSLALGVVAETDTLDDATGNYRDALHVISEPVF